MSVQSLRDARYGLGRFIHLYVSTVDCVFYKVLETMLSKNTSTDNKLPYCHLIETSNYAIDWVRKTWRVLTPANYDHK